jgi:hypothetical protein
MKAHFVSFQHKNTGDFLLLSIYDLPGNRNRFFNDANRRLKPEFAIPKLNAV